MGDIQFSSVADIEKVLNELQDDLSERVHTLEGKINKAHIEGYKDLIAEYNNQIKAFFHVKHMLLDKQLEVKSRHERK